MPGPPQRRAELAVLAASLVLCLAVSEISLRVARPIAGLDDGGEPPHEADAVRYEGSIFSRHVLSPSPLTVERHGFSYQINSLGYRGPELSFEKPAGVLRVMVYGGSAVFDIYANEQDAWPARLERELAQRSVAGVQVINAGIPGHASFDSVGRLFAEGHRFAPDAVLLYNAWNDLKYFGTEEPLLRAYGPYLPRRDALRTPQGRIDAFLARSSQLYRHLRLRFLMWDRDLGLEGRKARPSRTGFLSEVQLGQYALAVRQFVDLARNIGAEPVLVTQMRLAVAGSPPEDRERIRYDAAGLDHETLVRAFEATDRILAQVSREKGARLVDASGAMSGESRLFADHVHLNGAGQAALAAFVADALAPGLLASGSL